jgi:hypothetical protein
MTSLIIVSFFFKSRSYTCPNVILIQRRSSIHIERDAENSQSQADLTWQSEDLEELLPVPLLQGLRFQLADDRVALQKAPQHVLHVFKRGILPHARRHILGARQQTVDRLSQFPRLDGCPRHLSQFTNLAPYSGQRGPYCLEVAQFLENGLESRVTSQVEVKGFLGAANEIILFLNACKLSFKDVYRVHGGVGAHVSLYWPRLLPFMQNVGDLVLHDFVFRNDLELQTR